ncbi:hypothetical protein BCR36DRAFT_412466 [Piromyces finnis]|uniref:Uncharacterized protein n=1 Tax=Piromyces finnis TaxID=1754191 RepID=A0A1Y1V8Q7_9FUNG|nr:hypothetical protein BCR36DRAFT_412466 [Piromyces finnis]|eukprot:ORX49967.1 hypothetical protein BCR36DRAFT_412466 [Piromyces finnis]
MNGNIIKNSTRLINKSQYSVSTNCLNNIYKKLFYSTNANNKGLLGLVLNQDGRGGCLIDIGAREPLITRSDYFKRFTKRVGATSLFLGKDINDIGIDNTSLNKKKTNKKKKSKAGKLQMIDIQKLLVSPLLPHPDADPVDTFEFEFQLVKEALDNCSWKLNDSLEIRRSVISQHAARIVTGGFIMTAPKNGSINNPYDILNAMSEVSDEDKELQDQGFGELATMLTLSLKGKRSKAVSVCRKMSRFANQLAKHITIFNPRYISEEEYKKETKKTEVPEEDKEKILLNQKFMFDNEQTVAEAIETVESIDEVKVTVSSFVRWTL